MYSQKVLDIFYNPQNVGVIKGANGVGKIVDDTCGEIIKIYVTVENNRVVDSKFQAFGSPAIIAATSVAAALMQNKALAECEKITADQIYAELGGELPENKKYVINLAEAVIKKCVDNTRRKIKED